MAVAPVHLHDDGAGPPVVFLHAFPLDADMWQPQLGQLDVSYRCLRPDFWGFGGSPPAAASLSIDDFARSVLDALDRAEVTRFAVVGLSLGGYVALSLLRQASKRISHLVLAATRATADRPEARADRLAMAVAVRSEGVEVITESMLNRLLSERGRGNPEVTSLVRDCMLRATPGGVAACQEAMAGRADNTDLLADINVPTLVIGGAADTLIPVDEVRALAAGIPASRCTIVDGSGHLVNLEAPEMFNELIDEHFNRHS